jgi:hypothetical protein
MSIQVNEQGKVKPTEAMQKYINWILYQGTVKPTNEISDGRWQAIVKYLKREFGV